LEDPSGGRDQGPILGYFYLLAPKSQQERRCIMQYCTSLGLTAKTAVAETKVMRSTDDASAAAA